MQSNNKFTTVENIMARITSIHKQRQMNIEEIAQWCAECTIEIIGDADVMMDYNKVKCYVKDGKALLPCNIYRLRDVYNASDSRYNKYGNDGSHLIFSSSQTFDTDKNGYQYVYINYLGIVVDAKTGYPLIPRGQELACVAYCTWNLYFEDFLNNRLNATQWQFIDNQKTLHCSAAKNGFRHMTNDDMKEILNVVHNIIPNASKISLFHLDSAE